MFFLRKKFKFVLLSIPLVIFPVVNAYADQGIRATSSTSGVVYFTDDNWTGRWNFICFNNSCTPGTLVDGEWQRGVQNLVEGQGYTILLKVQDDVSGQYISDEFTVEFDSQNGGGQASPSPSIPPNVSPSPLPSSSPDVSPSPSPIIVVPPTNGLPGPIERGGSNSDSAAGLIRREGNTIITEFAERFKDRHESDDNHDAFVEEYADGSSYGIILRDTPNSLKVEVHSITPLTMVNFTFDHQVRGGFVDPPQYSGGGFMGGSDRRYDFEITDRWAQRRNNNEIITIEFTPRRKLNGNEPQYYSDIIRYRAGRGGVILDPEKPGQDQGAQNPLYFPGGPATVWPHLSYPNSATFGYSQAFAGIHRDLLDQWTLGRELFRANFTDGDNLNGPLNGNKLVLSGTNFVNGAEANSCFDCHFKLGRTTPPGLGSTDHQGFTGSGDSLRTSPMLIGLGLLEAVDQSTIEGFARENGGRVGSGRFGWKAEQPDIRSQIAKALTADLGESSPSAVIVDRLYAYMVSIGVPMSRHPGDQNTQGNNINLRFSESNTLSTSAIAAGERVFMDRCARCHIPEMKTGNSHPIRQFHNITIRPYTDLLLHDMGDALASSDGGPLARYWRTPPLWGLRLAAQTLGAPEGSNGNDDTRVRLMHDGRAAGIAEAIRLHGGDAADAASVADDQNLLLFLQSL